jgi:hypothetical protein
LPVPTDGAQRASGHRSLRFAVALVIAALIASAGLAANPSPAAAAGLKVVIVVGPAGSSTSNYILNAKKLATQARYYGATVIEIYSPNATWTKVKSAAQGANVFIYLGHGNGYPSPYGAFNKYTKNGVGLNTVAGSTKHTYYGEYYIDTQINFAPNAVVILNRLSASTATVPASCGPTPGRSSPRGSTALRSSCTACSGRTGRWARSSGAIRRPTGATTSRSRRRGRRARRRPWIPWVQAATTGRSSATSA